MMKSLEAIAATLLLLCLAGRADAVPMQRQRQGTLMRPFVYSPAHDLRPYCISE